MIMAEVNKGLWRCDSCQGDVNSIRNVLLVLWRGVMVIWEV